MIEKRKNPAMTDSEMYELSSIKEFIEKERRHDQLDRLMEVKSQKKVWFNIVLASFLLNLILLVFAIIGYLKDVQ
tara:strand:+ start:1354 stop:1578 length:225 start_codon:yes stop_codon:yes gene_type:complete